MEVEEYRRMYDVEDSYWWYVGLRKLLIEKIAKYSDHAKNIFLDLGCGTGANASAISKFGEVYALDISKLALGFCLERGLKKILCGSVSFIPFKKESFDIVVSFDVLCCREVGDDVRALRGFNAVLRQNGLLILNLPAFGFLSGTHDIAVHIARRYTRKELMSKLEKADFSIEFCSYRNFFLFPLVFIGRCLSKAFKYRGSDLRALPLPLNYFFLSVLRFENFLLRFLTFPFGSSLFCIAKKNPV